MNDPAIANDIVLFKSTTELTIQGVSSCVNTRWTSSRRSCGSRPCALFGRGEGVAASPPPWPPDPPPARGASRLLSLPWVQTQTSTRASEQDPKKRGKRETKKIISDKNCSPWKTKKRLWKHTNLKSINDSPSPLWDLLSVFPSAYLCVEHSWPAPAAQRKTEPPEEHAPESEASPPQNSQKKKSSSYIPWFFFSTLKMCNTAKDPNFNH